MEKDRTQKIRSTYGLVLALLSVVVGVLFIVQTWRIYAVEGKGSYTPERIGEMFRQIAIPVWLWIVLVVAGSVFACVYPEEKGRPKAYVDVKLALIRAKKRLPQGEYVSEIASVEAREEKVRAWIAAVAIAVCAVLLFVVVAVLLDIFYLPWISRAFFVKDGGLADRLFQSAIFSLFALAVASVGLIFIERSRKKEQKAYLDILVKAKKGEPPVEVEAPVKKCVCKEKWTAFVAKINFWEKLSPAVKKKVVFGLRVGLGVVGLAFVVWGIANGGMKDVLSKAINICTQCIGLG